MINMTNVPINKYAPSHGLVSHYTVTIKEILKSIKIGKTIYSLIVCSRFNSVAFN